ncbi:MAG: DUF4340 domain-containing protein [Patescibacteria group bacterium]|nr:DUF4340 domain-containing protein [Patescibacteria group bacterium]
MQIKRTYILGIIFILLLGTAYFVKTAPWANHKETSSNFFVFDKNVVDKIEIVSEVNSSILEKQNDLWVVASANNFKADQTTVESMLKTVLEIKIGTLISDNADKQSIYEVGEKKGIAVKIFSNDKNFADFVIGKNGPSYNTNYFRIAGNNKVYLSDVSMRIDFSRPDYRDMRILTLNQANISKIEFDYQSKAKNVVIEKENEGWKIVSSEKICKQEIVDEILSIISNLNAQDIVEDEEKEKISLDKPELKLSIFQGDDKKVLLINSVEQEENEGKKYYLVLEGNEIIYSVSGYLGEKLMKQKKDFVE